MSAKDSQRRQERTDINASTDVPQGHEGRQNWGNSSQFVTGEFHHLREIVTSFQAEFGDSFSNDQTLAPPLHILGDMGEMVA